jgi:hypothetical protein
MSESRRIRLTRGHPRSEWNAGFTPAGSRETRLRFEHLAPRSCDHSSAVTPSEADQLKPQQAVANEYKRREVDAKVTALVATRFGGSYRAAFAHYDTDGNGVISKDELKALLSDAGSGAC